MKHKKRVKSLTLNKSTIANLEMNSARGGVPTTTYTMRLDCDLSKDCLTFDLTNCESWEFPGCVPGTATCATNETCP
jgi:hypothetical protein